MSRIPRTPRLYGVGRAQQPAQIAYDRGLELEALLGVGYLYLEGYLDIYIDMPSWQFAHYKARPAYSIPYLEIPVIVAGALQRKLEFYFLLYLILLM